MQKLDTIDWKWRKMEKMKKVDTRYYKPGNREKWKR